MIKKTYIKPTMEIVNVAITQIMNGSIEFSNRDSGAGDLNDAYADEALSKPRVFGAWE